MMEFVAKAAAVGMIGSICCVSLRKYMPELSLVLALVTGGIVLWMLVGFWVEIRKGMDMLLAYSGFDRELMAPVCKVTLISLLTKLSGQLCRDAGEGTVAVCCELGGTVAALGATVPLIERLMNLIVGLVS